jgi:hypothetical protein
LPLKRRNEVFMARMTEEEAWALDDLVTNSEITLGPNGSDWLSQRELRMLGMSNMTVNYLLTKAKSDHKSPAQLIDEMVGKEIAATTA